MRARCPHCDRVVSIPDEGECAASCPSCGERVRRARKRDEGESPDRPDPRPEPRDRQTPSRDEEEPRPRRRAAPDAEEEPRPRRRAAPDAEEEPRPRRRAAEAEESPRPARRRGVGPAKTDWFTMKAIILPALGLWVVLSFFSILVAGSLFLLGLAIGTVGLKRMQTALSRMGLMVEYDEAPFWMRGGWLTIYLQIQHARRRPDLLGLWLFMEALSVLLLVGSVVICTAVEPPLYPGWSPSVPAPRGGSPANVPLTPAPQVPPPHVTGDLEVDRALADLADKGHFDRRGPAAERLGRMKPDDRYRGLVARKLAEAVLGTVEFGRGEAARAMVVWATAAEVPDLIRMLRQPGPVREAGGKALVTVGAAAEPELLKVAEADPDTNVRMAAIDALAEVGTGNSLPVLQRFVDAHEAFVDGHARQAIAAIKRRGRR